MNTPRQTEISRITVVIKELINCGVPEDELLLRATYQFPNLTPAELSQALQVATAAAERRALRPH